MGRAARRERERSPEAALVDRLSIIQPQLVASWFLFTGAEIVMLRDALARQTKSAAAPK